jgi:GNAT superfamily N-acetyltransferase
MRSGLPGAPALATAPRTPDFAGTPPHGPAAPAGEEPEMRTTCYKVAHEWHTERRSVTLRGAVNTLCRVVSPNARHKTPCDRIAAPSRRRRSASRRLIPCRAPNVLQRVIGGDTVAAVPDVPDHLIVLRLATVADRADVLALVPRLVAFGPPPWRDVDAMVATDLHVVSQAFESAPEDASIYVAECGSRVAGFVHVHWSVDYYRRRRHAHVADLVVLPGFEGRGLASRMLDRAEQWAREHGYDWLTISVFEGNQRAARLYEHLGFRREIVHLIKPLAQSTS